MLLLLFLLLRVELYQNKKLCKAANHGITKSAIAELQLTPITSSSFTFFVPNVENNFKKRILFK